jgi:hypothetical protein
VRTLIRALIGLLVFSALLPSNTQIGAVSPGQRQFLRVYASPATLAACCRPDVVPIQDMDAYTLAVANAEGMQSLRNSGIAFQAMLALSPGHAYYLARCMSPDCVIRTRAGVTETAEVEPNVLLLSLPVGRPPQLARDSRLVRLLPDRPAPAHPAIPDELAGTAALKPDPEILAVAAQVSTEQFRDHIAGLQGFETRYYDTAGCRSAAEYIYNAFRSYGLSARYQNFPANGIVTRNVLAVQPGKSDSASILVLSAHYDSYSYDMRTNAPGADDNASGVSAVLEAARILSKYRFDFTIHYAAFGAEEIGLDGSRVYADDARLHNRRILADLNLDMVAYADQLPEDLDVVSNPPSRWLGNLFAAVTRTYAKLPSLHLVRSSWPYSDHAPFWAQRYPALTAIEDIDAPNPYYHTPSDTLDKLDIGLGSQCAKALTASAALIAQLYDPALPRPPRALQATVVEDTNARRVSLSWKPRVGKILGYNVYRSHSSHRGFVRLNRTPRQSTYFSDMHASTNMPNFYVVTTVRADGAESHHSNEANDIQ